MPVTERKRHEPIHTTAGALESPFTKRGGFELTTAHVNGYRLAPVFVSADGTEGRILGHGTFKLTGYRDLKAYRRGARTARQTERRKLQCRRLRALQDFAERQ